MSYPSVDALQKTLSESVFIHTSDKKKAAGRALGTLVEIITYYLLRSWGFRNSIAIERRLGEYNNRLITHNVEYSLHPTMTSASITFDEPKLPLSISKLKKVFQATDSDSRKRHLISRYNCSPRTVYFATHAPLPNILSLAF